MRKRLNGCWTNNRTKNMMKRSIFLLTVAMCALVASAQTQQGYVKTLGRPNQKGVALSGVSVRVKGGHNAVLSGHDGTFAMAMPASSASASRASPSPDFQNGAFSSENKWGLFLCGFRQSYYK